MKSLDLARDSAARFLESLPERHVGAKATHAELKKTLAVPLSEDGEPEEDVLRALIDGAEPGIVASAGPRYFGYVIGGSHPVAIAADWMTSAWDQNCGLFSTSAAASVVEEIVRDWLLDLFDLPRAAGVGLVTGCQMANFTALAAARHAVLESAGWDVERKGLMGAPPVTVLVSAESHVTIHRALRFLGFGLDAARRVETDGQGRMSAGALHKALRDVEGPTIVCAQAGNVNTGSFDPLDEVLDAAHARGAWVHVDGAFGLWAAASAGRRHLLKGFERADSWATDAHKWLNVPYDCGVVIVADPRAHAGAMSATAEYLEQSAGAELDQVNFVPEFSRRGRGFPIYAVLRHLGRRGIENLVDRCCAQARLMASLLAADDGVEILNDVVLNQVLVRFGKGSGAEKDETTRRVIAAVQREGTLWLSGTTWHGMAAMRVSLSNWSTTDEDVRKSADAILVILSEGDGT
ncbi:MAG TPA: aminotransferase class V-fold PLP-dependent enzyme [Thermoanaerobaculia bacterium]|nr:aminotransferase class V-fold PLP-dependent enzyme [Thermoanaerobaculia bacterium]